MSEPRILADALEDYVEGTSLTTEEWERLHAAWQVVDNHAANDVGIKGER